MAGGRRGLERNGSHPELGPPAGFRSLSITSVVNLSFPSSLHFTYGSLLGHRGFFLSPCLAAADTLFLAALSGIVDQLGSSDGATLPMECTRRRKRPHHKMCGTAHGQFDVYVHSSMLHNTIDVGGVGWQRQSATRVQQRPLQVLHTLSTSSTTQCAR